MREPSRSVLKTESKRACARRANDFFVCDSFTFALTLTVSKIFYSYAVLCLFAQLISRTKGDTTYFSSQNESKYEKGDDVEEETKAKLICFFFFFFFFIIITSSDDDTLRAPFRDSVCG